MSKRKILTLAMAICMAAILVVGGTMAYFTDTDDKNNTFTLGNVNIHIDEWMGTTGDPTTWTAYEDQHLAPIAHSKTTFNKLAETVNDGSEPAYIRTFVTCPTAMYDYLGLGFNKTTNTQVNNDGKTMYGLTRWTDIGTCDIGGVKTSVFLCEYEGIVGVGESVLSLTKVWVYESVTNDIAETFGLKNGAFEVKVGSQGIQAANLTYTEAMAALGTYAEAVETLFDATAGSFVAK